MGIAVVRRSVRCCVLAALPLGAVGCVTLCGSRPGAPAACPDGSPAPAARPGLGHGRLHPHAAPVVAVTGLVRFPGFVPIPPCGLPLGDAVGAAGGDQPAQFFGGLNPANVLVTLERRGGTYHFSLPLVTHDSAGRVRLVEGDRVKVEPAADTPLGRSIFPRSASAPNGDRAAWRALTQRDDVGRVPLAFDVPFVDQGAPQQDVTVTVAGLGGDADRAADAAPPAPDAPPTPPAVLTVRTNLAPPADDLGRAAGAGGAGSLREFSDASRVDAQSTVLLLHRQVPGESHLFVLLRPGSSAGAAAANRGLAEELLGKVTVIPGDSVGVGALVQLPVVLNSLAAPERYAPGADHPVERPCHDGAIRQAAARLVGPVVSRLKGAAGQACPAAGP